MKKKKKKNVQNLRLIAASFSCCLVLDGTNYMFGILLGPLMSHYDEGKGVISMVGSVLVGTCCLCAPVASVLVNKFGARLLMPVGAEDLVTIHININTGQSAFLAQFCLASLSSSPPSPQTCCYCR